MVSIRLLTSTFVAFGAMALGLAQTPPPAAPASPAPQGDAKPEPPKKDPKVEEYEKAVKDLKKIEGPFTFYQRKRDVLLELPESQLNRTWLMQGTFQTGVVGDGAQSGFPINFGPLAVFEWQRMEDSVWLVRPNTRFMWEGGDPLAIASQRTFPNAILASYRIEATNPEKKLLLVNVTNFFYGDSIRLSELMGQVLGGEYMLDREKSFVDSIKGFDDVNTVQARLHYMSPRGAQRNPLAALLGIPDPHLEDSRSAPLRVSYTMWYRKDTGYRSRLADPRIGYFTRDYFNVSRFSESDRTERLINRFHLVKKDPTAVLSEPVKPIEWVIDGSVPPEWRDAVAKGILVWNDAFEKIGFKNAIVVRQSEGIADYDHADGRHNVVRWAMSPDAAYAIALFRTDPFTGQIYNASVLMDANMVTAAFREHERLVLPDANARKRALDVAQRDPHRGCSDEEHLYDPEAGKRRELRKELAKEGWDGVECNLAQGMLAESQFAWSVIQASGFKVSRKAYTEQFVTHVIAHEIGHCLGLRHNFVASTNLTTAQLANDALTGKVGVSASLMEYTPVNILATLKGSGNFYTKTLGPYDYLAIQYGYSDVPGGSTLGERFALSRIASKTSQPGLRWMGDENANQWDPYVVTFDCAKDPVNYSMEVLKAARRVKADAIKNFPKPGTSFEDRTNALLFSISRVFREGRYTARFVGGMRGSKAFAGDPGALPSLMPTPAAEQRQAMRLIVQNCFKPESFELPASVKINLGRDPNIEDNASWTAPLRELIAGQQAMLFASLLSSNTTDRIVENEFKLGANGYGIDEHYATLLGAVFQEIGNGKSLDPLRRDLQRFAVQFLLTQAGGAQGGLSEDARLLATDSLRRIAARFQAASNGATLNSLTKMHYRDSAETIRRFLQRTQVVSR